MFNYSNLCPTFLFIHHYLIVIMDINQSPVLCPHTNERNTSNILANLWANSLLCRPTLICYVQGSRLIQKM